MRKRYLQLCLAAGMAFVANEASRSWLALQPGAGAPQRIFAPERCSRGIGVPRAAGGDGVTSTLTKTSTLIKKAFLCSAFVVLSAIGPILFDWVKRHNAGRFPFFVPALVFHAWAIDGLIGLLWAAAQGRKGLKLLWRPDMLWRFFITTSLFVAGDMLSFMSIAHLDVGTFSLVGKALAIILTVLLSRVVLKKGQSPQQYALVVAVAVATVVFCQSEAHARQMASQALSRSSVNMASMEWCLGLTERSIAVFLTSLAAVLQEQLLTFRPGIPFLVQQSWMSLVWLALRCLTARFQQLADLGAALFLRSQRPHHGADGEKTGRSGQVPLRAHLFGRLLFLCGAHWICNVHSARHRCLDHKYCMHTALCHLQDEWPGGMPPADREGQLRRRRPGNRAVAARRGAAQ